ncbi:phytoene/squalene synthase family protein [Paenibacillus sp. FSL H8-0537]|uniref:phytoene/squalene synthase family protein n=1 Tax=Paenibacillus sp. FSL H8-0537 TaxID=2921399 RepID=UPI0031015E2B
METAFSLNQCEAMIRKGSSSFYKAFGFLPSPRKEAVYVIYAFCRIIDNAVDEPEKSPYTIDELEARFAHLEQADGHFIWPALRWLFHHFPVSKQPFFRQMEGQRRDLVLTHYETMEQLEDYCYLVAGTVGEMLLPVLHNHPDEQIVEAGIYLGKAMQIVNIVRDVGEDQDRGRRYLPLEMLRQYGYSEQSFEAGVIDDHFRALIHALERQAKDWFHKGLANLSSYPPESAFAVELAAGFYGAILDQVIANRYEVYAKRAVVGPLTKLKIYKSIKEKYLTDIMLESGAVSL